MAVGLQNGPEDSYDPWSALAHEYCDNAKAHNNNNVSNNMPALNTTKNHPHLLSSISVWWTIVDNGMTIGYMGQVSLMERASQSLLNLVTNYHLRLFSSLIKYSHTDPIKLRI